MNVTLPNVYAYSSVYVAKEYVVLCCMFCVVPNSHGSIHSLVAELFHVSPVEGGVAVGSDSP